MTKETLNLALYKRMNAEQAQYREVLLDQPPEEILKNAYEYAVREDILLTLEYNNLDEDKARALLNMENPLSSVFHAFEETKSGYMDTLLSCMEQAGDHAVGRDVPEYDVVEVFGVHALFADERINVEDLPDGLYRYEMRGADFDPGQPATVEDCVAVNFAGTLITAEPLAIPERGFLPLTEEDGLNFLDETASIVYFQYTQAAIQSIEKTMEPETPLTEDDVRQEAQRILDTLKAMKEPNSPDGRRCTVEISPNFIRRSEEADRRLLFQLLPFRSLTLIPMPDSPRVLIAVSAQEQRGRKKQLRKPKGSRKNPAR